MNQSYARSKYVKKYCEIYEEEFDRAYHVEEHYMEVEDNEYHPLGLFSPPNRTRRVYCGSTNNYSSAKEKAIKKTTSILAKDILESKMMEELDEYSLYLVIRSLHRKGFLTFGQNNPKNDLLMSVVIKRYISIIPQLVKLGDYNNMQNVFIYAIQEEDLPLLKALVEARKRNGLPIYAYGLARYTAKNKSTEILEFLIKNNMGDDEVAMQASKEEWNREMRDVLLEKSPNFSENYRDAIKANDIEFAKRIIKTNKLLDVRRNDMFIKFAVSYTNDTELVQMLIDAGANVNAKYDIIDAKAYRACISYDKAIGEGIEDFGNILTKAEMKQKFEIAELLKEAGAR